jgi:hypothetical protein
MTSELRSHCAFSFLVLAGLATVFAGSALAQVQKIGAPPEASNMRLLGHNDLQARSAYQPVIVHQGDRYLAYVGHHGGTADVPKPINPLTHEPENNGTSIVDVTDPRNPKYLKHIPGQAGAASPDAGGAQMVRVCEGSRLPRAERNKFYMLRTFGTQGHEIWDVTDSSNPLRLAVIGGNYRDTHKSWWECDTGIAYLVSAVPGWRVKRMTEVYDLSDPAKPVKIRDFGLPGQEPGATGAVPMELHGPISLPQANRIYFGYGSSSGGVLQIVDREKLLNGPKEPTPANLLYPQVGRMDLSPLTAAHTTFPMLQMPIAEFANDGRSVRDMVLITNEATQNECKPQGREMVWFTDISIETHPQIVSNFYVPEGSGNFCSRGGRFGAHSSNESMAPVFYKKLAFVTFFNAGVRAIDVRNPYRPREVGYFIPAITEATDKRCLRNEPQRCKVAIQTNNVETDDRGYIYIVDRANTGLHILEVTGQAREIAGLGPTP